MQAGEVDIVTEVLPPAAAIVTLSATGVQPWHPRAVAWLKAACLLAHCIHRSHDLMSGNQRDAGQRQIALHGVQISVADAAD
jgi:hypothetical protein